MLDNLFDSKLINEEKKKVIKHLNLDDIFWSKDKQLILSIYYIVHKIFVKNFVVEKQFILQGFFFSFIRIYKKNCFKRNFLLLQKFKNFLKIFLTTNDYRL